MISCPCRKIKGFINLKMSSCFTISLSLLFFFFINFRSTESAPFYIWHYCSNATLFAPNSTYQSNLNNLLSSLSAAAPNNADGFANATAGQNPPDRAYGLFLCSGDVNATTCSDCVATGTKDILKRCPYQRVSVIWYDECMLRYSNASIYSVMEQAPAFTVYQIANITDPTRFMQILGQTMNDIATRASDDESGKKVAVAETNFTSLQQLYTLAQCTPDLTASDCNTCLRVAIAGLPQGKQGGRTFTTSCSVRFELYPFYNASAVAAPAPPPSQTPSPPPAPVIRPSGGKSNSTKTVIIAVATSVSAMLFIGVAILLAVKRKKQPSQRVEGEVEDEISTTESLQFDFRTIRAATDNFSNSMKLGQGGFDAVYMGRLTNGQEIAVKRLSRNSGQGEVEFKNEVVLLAGLQHRNLVRLLGFCLEGVKRLLIYEFVPNSSLDQFIFDPLKRANLDWDWCHKIIMGVARGLLYLHEDFRLCIIHRDLKASNILLDLDMNPKISDFGMARLLELDQTQAETNRIVGTYGYMAPEYVMHGNFSVKSDVFSFGVLVLEIVSGRKNNLFRVGDNTEDLTSYVWKSWREGTISNIIDPSITSGSSTEIARCIQIGLLCVQEHMANRPTMASVLLMLNSHSVTLQVPSQPAFFIHSGAESDISSSQDYSLRVFEANRSRSRLNHLSKNEVSMTKPYPR